MKTLLISLLVLLPAFGWCQDNQEKTSEALYYNYGIPSINKDWSPDEFVMSLDTICYLVEKHLLPLPDSVHAAGLLEKITRIENYWFLESDLTNQTQKMMACIQLQRPMSRLYLLYYNDTTKVGGVKKYSHETISVEIMGIYLIGMMAKLADQFIIDHPDLTDVQKEGVSQMKNGLNTYLSGSFLILENEFANYHAADVCDLSEAIFLLYKNRRSGIDELTRKEFDKRSLQMSKNHKNDCVRKSALLKS